MKILLKIILVLFAVFLAFMSVLTIITAVNASFIDTIYDYMEKAVQMGYLSTVLLIFTALVFAVSAVMLLMISFRTRKKETYVVTATEMGEVRISFETVKNIVFNSLTYIEELGDTKVVLNRNENGICIAVSAEVQPDIIIPDLAGRMQVEIKNAVEKSTGVPVNDVKVNVERIFSEVKKPEKPENINF